jgi:hypothetical protein
MTDVPADPAMDVDAGQAAGGAARSPASLVSGVVAAISGIAPHVLHHVGPLAGTALLAGAGGTVLFGLAGFALSVPMLLRLRRRFRSWVAPGVASLVFLVVYLFSALVVGPMVTASPAGANVEPTSTPLASGHDEHHP